LPELFFKEVAPHQREAGIVVQDAFYMF